MKTKTFIVLFQNTLATWSEIIEATSAPMAGLLACESYGHDQRCIVKIVIIR